MRGRDLVADRWRDAMWWLSGGQGVTLWSGLFGRSHHRWHERGLERAMQAPRYRAIEERIGTPDGGIWLADEGGFDLWEEQAEIFVRLSPHPRSLRLKAWWDRHVGPVPGRQWQVVERARWGWAKRDVWQLDDYLSRLISGAVGHLAATDHGMPEGMEHEEWLGVLDEIARGFEAYGEARTRDGSPDEAALDGVRRSLELMARHWSYLNN